MKIKYTTDGVDICEIKCSKHELDDALKELDKNLSQMTRIRFKFSRTQLYIYHSTFSGYKAVSKEQIDNYWHAIRYISSQRKIQTFKGLKKQILAIK